MEAYIEINHNPNKSHKQIALPINFDQLKAEFKKAYDLTQKQLSNLKIFYTKGDLKINLENDSTYKSFLSENNVELIEAEINKEENKEENKKKIKKKL